MTRTIRASSLPLALACPASQTPPAVPLASDSPESRLGSACHQALAVLVRDGGGPFQQAIEDAASEWRVDLEEVSRLAWNGKRAWERLEEFFPAPNVEGEFPPIATTGDLFISGHMDLCSLVDGEFRLADWKTSREDGDYEQQMRAYAWRGLMNCPDADSALAIVVRLREMTQDVYRWSRRELDAWHAGVVRDTADVERYRPGRHCGFCPRRTECDAFGNYVIDALSNLGDAPKSMLPADGLVEAYDRIRVAESAVELARNAVRAELAHRGGSATASDGRTLALVQQDRQEINAAAAWPVLSERFTQADLQAAAKLTKTAVTKLAMDAAPRGGKGRAAKEIIEELDAKGAICTSTVERLEIKRGNSSSREIEAGDTAVSRPAITAGDGDRDPAA